ncbi:hypothetical protein WMY93_033794 [Mugilogobius chulae]|uniref:Peptidase M14 domain-containing protein n=1 Tax=Mugilogobius chulae TaxID=88201 RepID=A0AAW0MLV7_9GOBI
MWLTLELTLLLLCCAQANRVDYDYFKYHNMQEIGKWKSDMAASYRDVVSVIEYGKTYENRPIELLKIGFNGTQKKIIWMDCGIHAREWISPAFCQYFVKTTRLWRKNRSPGPCGCTGTDLNRNFNVNWGTVGVSFDCCSITYPGRGPVSEPEAQAVTQFVGKISDSVLAFLTIHSYGQMLLIPYGHPEVIAPNHQELMEVGLAAADAIEKVHGMKYKVGTSPDILYPFSGGSQDFARLQGVPYSFTFELRDNGTHGFVLPEDQIRPTCEEAYSGAMHIISYAHHKVYNRGASAGGSVCGTVLLALLAYAHTLL